MATIKDTKRDKFKHSEAFLDKRHGDAKKGGAGRHGWGLPGDELKGAVAALNERDPNYDSGAEDVMLVPVDTEPTTVVHSNFKDSFQLISRFKAAMHAALHEFLSSFDPDEFIRCVNEQQLSAFHHELPKIAIIDSIDKSEEQRKCVSSLLELLARREIVRPSQMEAGFQQVFNRLSDLALDSPNAEAVLQQFLLRAVSGGYLSEEVANNIGEGTEKLKNQTDVTAAKQRIATIIEEYFSSEDLAEAETQIAEMKAPHFHHMVVKQIISLAMDRTNRERELASYLISTLAGGVLRMSEVEKGFEALLYRVDDVIKDVPNVLQLLSSFIARAVADECLPPAFLLRTNLPPDDLGSKVVKQAEVLLNNHHAFVRLQSVWGPGDGRSVPQLKRLVREAIEEYFESGDIAEASKCVRDLNASYFMHEVVKRLIVLAADQKERERTLAADLLLKLLAEETLSQRQYAMGIARVQQVLPDLELDSPGAGKVLKNIQDRVAAVAAPNS